MALGVTIHDSTRAQSAALAKPEPTRSTGLGIAFFAHDSRESVVVKRVKAFQAAGAAVTGFMFYRERDKEQPDPVWENVELGATVDRNYLARLPKLCRALWTVMRHRRALAECDVIYARNFDMMALTTVAKWLSRSRAQLVYEVLDVQRAFVGDGLLESAFRWCERRLLSACDMLVVSSPMFMTRYFEPQQGYTGPWFLLENKVAASQVAAVSKPAMSAPPSGPPWIIGWFGTLRCMRSLKILSRLAAVHPDKVTVLIRGTLSEEDISSEAMRAETGERDNFRYLGPYQSPRDLAEIYGQIHFTWAIDFLDAGSNSDWLLPNRLYEGGLFHSIAIAREGTATGAKVAHDSLGVTLQEPIEESLASWLLDMNAERYAALAEAAQRAPRSLFVDESDTAELLRILSEQSKGSAAAR